MSDSITFHGLEEYHFNKLRDNPNVICLFKTNRFGIYQVKYEKLDGAWKLEALPQEPDFQMLTKSEQFYIAKVCRIVWRLVHDAPAATERFDEWETFI